eukprot:1159211-Pelagomonas_calceolata.AAC.5
MEEETSGLKQILQGMANSVKADDDALGDFREVSDKMPGLGFRFSRAWPAPVKQMTMRWGTQGSV